MGGIDYWQSIWFCDDFYIDNPFSSWTPSCSLARSSLKKLLCWCLVMLHSGQMTKKPLDLLSPDVNVASYCSHHLSDGTVSDSILYEIGGSSQASHLA
jgi:hypothetical protein